MYKGIVAIYLCINQSFALFTMSSLHMCCVENLKFLHMTNFFSTDILVKNTRYVQTASKPLNFKSITSRVLGLPCRQQPFFWSWRWSRGWLCSQTCSFLPELQTLSDQVRVTLIRSSDCYSNFLSKRSRLSLWANGFGGSAATAQQPSYCICWCSQIIQREIQVWY